MEKMKIKSADVPLLAIPNVRSCRIVERINRFVVAINIGGKLTKAHITNSGRLHEFLIRGREGFCFETPHAKKTRFRLFAVIEKGLGALIDTQLQMRAFEAAQQKELIPWLRGAVFIRRNPRLGVSLMDYLFDKKGTPMFLEVKSAVLRGGRFAMYPDCPTIRGQRHVEELLGWAKKGGAAFILFVAALPCVEGFKPYRLADPRLCDLLGEAKDLGVQVKALGLYFQPVDSFVYLYNSDLDVVIPPG
jgi:sugar fermentation stimulation protein A